MQGLFQCPACGATVERVISDGKRNKSCGCARTSVRRTTKQIYDEHRNLFWVYHGIKARCCNPNNIAYKYYGGRGIKICAEWLADSRTFFQWALDHGWTRGLEIDRINNDKDYSPDNCRIVTHRENSQNRTTTRLSVELAAAIRQKHADGTTNYRELGRIFNASEQCIRSIILGQTWVT
jgi:hypothetical protein